jgi:hypothetical protein
MATHRPSRRHDQHRAHCALPDRRELLLFGDEIGIFDD